MVAKKVSKKESPEGKSSGISSQSVRNNISIILGVFSVLISFIFPYIVAITGTLGVIFAYLEKGKVSKKSNLWAFILNIVGIFLAIILLTISLVMVLFYSSSEWMGGTL